MNLITDTLQGLVRRKLWPVALLLVGALVAVPLVLAKTPEPPVAASQPRWALLLVTLVVLSAIVVFILVRTLY